jgi:hypothetical protein
MGEQPTRHAKEYWIAKQAAAATKLANDMRPLQALEHEEEIGVVLLGRSLALLQAAKLLLAAEQFDRRAQELKK